MTRTIAAGFAAVDVTPAIPVALSGFAAREGPAVAVHDALFARAMALDDGARRVLVVALDVIGVEASFVGALRRRLAATGRVDPDAVFVAATHTHGGPAVLAEAFLGPVDPAVLARIEEGAVQAALEALASLETVEIEVALGHEGTVAHNRRVPGGPIDPEVPVAVFRRPAAAAGRGSGDVVGVVTGYACHPVTLGADNRSVTRDFPGYVVDALEAHWSGSVALFFTGCCGQLNTGHAAADSWVARPTSRRTFAEARRLGGLVARAAIDAVEGGAARAIDAAPLRVARSTVALPFDPPATTPGADLARWRSALDDPAEAARWPLLRAQVAWAERVAHAPVVAVEEVEAAGLAVGELAFAWFPGEVFVEHGLALKAEVAADGPVIAVSHAHAAPGYLPHPTAFAAGGYEVAEAFRFYGRPGPFSPAAGERLAATVADLVRRVRDRSDRGGDRIGPSHR